MGSRDTHATFRFIDLKTHTVVNEKFVKPWGKVDDGGRSYKYSDLERPVGDIRGRENEFGTDVSGFAVFHKPAQEKEFTDDNVVRESYYPEVEALLREKLPGVKKVVIFDHTIRRRTKDSPRQPVQQVHVDQTPGAAEVRVRRHLPSEEAEELLKGRYQIINVWRPIGHNASDFPLALVDWRTTSPRDFIKVDLLYPKRQVDDDGDDRGKEALPTERNSLDVSNYEIKGETYAVASSDQHRFFYMSDMTPEEVMFIKCCDSRSQNWLGDKAKGVAGMTPHTAFQDPNTPKDAPGRQSIEVRCLVFYE
ncbi:hypothetical protein NA57DRAFT_63249 [Rhizodiscina lignyota]|uniref:Methyltransferase n=1 Tax=Rhizodiscina lignyota TaxID=1504668 RepID=A0A9P4IS56_9PEZI|nr:hypothetical protein NA57DRAFT_63249 [Rhizodiscina lignyota]